MSVDVNYIAVIVAAVVNMIIGWVWYGPAFGKTWMRLAGVEMTKTSPEEMKSAMKKSLGFGFAGALIMAFTFFHFIVYGANFTGNIGTGAGLFSGFWLWLGFVVPVVAGKQLWEGKPWKLWCIEAGYYLFLLLVNGAILGAWM